MLSSIDVLKVATVAACLPALEAQWKLAWGEQPQERPPPQFPLWKSGGTGGALVPPLFQSGQA